MKKLTLLVALSIILITACQKHEEKTTSENKVEVNKQQIVENWANMDDILDVKSETLIDTVLFRQEMNELLSTEKIFELFGSGYHNFYVYLTISKEGKTDYTITLYNSLIIGYAQFEFFDLIFKEGVDFKKDIPKIKVRQGMLVNKNKNVTQPIFERPISDDRGIFKSKPGILNGKPVRSIKLFEARITIDKNKNITKPWTIHEANISRYREHLDGKTIYREYWSEKIMNRYWFMTGLPAVSIDGFELIRKQIVYPETAIKNNITGRVIVQVFADEQGKYAGYQLIKGLGYGCDEAVIEAIKKAPFQGYATGQRSSIIVPFEFGPPKSSPIDLAVQFFQLNPDKNVYNNIELGIVNKNKLDKNLNQNYSVYVYINGYRVFQNYCTGISQNPTQLHSWFRWNADKPGSYNYVIYIDPENQINDSNRENNIVKGTFEVK